MPREGNVTRVIFVPAEQIEKENRLSVRTTMRLERALALFKTGEYDLIILSGGIFNPLEVQTVSAARLMKTWLLQKEVKRECIITENHSLDTYENIKFSFGHLWSCFKEKYSPFSGVVGCGADRASIIEGSFRGEITLISDYWHLERFKVIVAHSTSVFATMPWIYEDSGYKLDFIGRIKEKIFLLITKNDPEGTGWLARFNRYCRRQL
ncbi:MAG TPA: YdcF family protein [Candidatus Magasanikbacteria bacterium]|nr:YdcF family protein [Candidatus Magasanikbacteria bacterium]